MSYPKVKLKKTEVLSTNDENLAEGKPHSLIGTFLSFCDMKNVKLPYILIKKVFCCLIFLRCLIFIYDQNIVFFCWLAEMKIQSLQKVFSKLGPAKVWLALEIFINLRHVYGITDRRLWVVSCE